MNRLASVSLSAGLTLGTAGAVFEAAPVFAAVDCTSETAPTQLAVEKTLQELKELGAAGIGAIVVDGRQSPEDCLTILQYQENKGIYPRKGYAGQITLNAAFKDLEELQNKNSPELPVSVENCPDRFEKGQKVSAICGTSLLSLLATHDYADDQKLRIATYQKVAGLSVDGIMGPITANSILAGEGLDPANPVPNMNGEGVYVDKEKQLGYFIENGEITAIFSVSTGTEKPYKETAPNGKIITGDGHTPTGNFKVYREASEKYVSPNNGYAMPHARHFNGGVTVHEGIVDILGRASHACVRVAKKVIALIVGRGFGKGDFVVVVE